MRSRMCGSRASRACRRHPREHVVRKLEAENRKLRAALEHERRMRAAEVDAAERRGRVAKIDWLCQSIQNRGYRKFLKTELDSSLALIDVLDVANHVDEFPEFEQSFSWTHLRVKVAIRHIVELWLKKNTAAASGSSRANVHHVQRIEQGLTSRSRRSHDPQCTAPLARRALRHRL